MATPHSHSFSRIVLRFSRIIALLQPGSTGARLAHADCGVWSIDATLLEAVVLLVTHYIRFRKY